ncbi:MAG: hypothetical protein HQK52_01355 [Oligoflexia bacterium]|nr:hypothetical protein [Oligoflexia bacterium]
MTFFGQAQHVLCLEFSFALVYDKEWKKNKKKRVITKWFELAKDDLDNANIMLKNKKWLMTVFFTTDGGDFF